MVRKVLALATVVVAAPLQGQAGSCYEVSLGPWEALDPIVENSEPTPPADLDAEAEDGDYLHAIPTRIELRSDGVIGVPEDSLDVPHSRRDWWIRSDTLQLSLSNGHAGTRSKLARNGEGWSGIAETSLDYLPAQRYWREIRLTPVPCRAPPMAPASFDIELPRVVEVGAATITLGAALPSTPSNPRGNRKQIVRPTSGLWEGADTVLVKESRDGLVAEVELRYPKSFDVHDLIRRVSSRFGPPTHPLSSDSPVWRNRTTFLIIRAWENLPTWVVTLEDPRIR